VTNSSDNEKGIKFLTQVWWFSHKLQDLSIICYPWSQHWRVSCKFYFIPTGSPQMFKETWNFALKYLTFYQHQKEQIHRPLENFKHIEAILQILWASKSKLEVSLSELCNLIWFSAAACRFFWANLKNHALIAHLEWNLC